MTAQRVLIFSVLAVVAGAVSLPAHGGVIVLANRAERKVSFTLIQPDGRRAQQTLARGEVVPAAVANRVAVVFEDGPRIRHYELQANGVYSFHTDGDKLDLVQHPLPETPAGEPTSQPTPEPPNAVCTIPVKILADDKEPTPQRVWEKRYRERLAKASEIIEQSCRVRFQVVAVGAWTSDNTAHELEKLIAEFERKVRPAPARLAIGFTGQYETLREDKHMGGTREPFHPYILIREWGRQITEAERLQILVHELGHFLGAAHSPDEYSVMRADLSARLARLRNFPVGFDAPNTLVLWLVGEELRTRPLAHIGQLPPTTKVQLRAVYSSLAAALPNDSAAPRYLAALDQSRGLAGEPPERRQAVVAGARSVVRAVTEAARKNRQLPEKDSPAVAGPLRLDGDRLTAHYFRQAAGAARQLPREVAAAAFLLGLGVALDDSALLRDTPIVGDLERSLESEPERAARLAELGVPTMHARHDLTQHFAVSAALVVLVGLQGAEGAGILKELADARSGSGFSFADLSADLAGIVFARAVGDGKLPLARLEESFVVGDFVPPADGLKEGIGWDEFVSRYGSPPDSRLAEERAALLKRIRELPAYR
jgi:hypothetical protein